MFTSNKILTITSQCMEEPLQSLHLLCIFTTNTTAIF